MTRLGCLVISTCAQNACTVRARGLQGQLYILVMWQDKAWETELVQAGFGWDTGAEVARDNVTRLPFHCRLADREHPVLNIWNSSGTR